MNQSKIPCLLVQPHTTYWNSDIVIIGLWVANIESNNNKKKENWGVFLTQTVYCIYKP